MKKGDKFKRIYNNQHVSISVEDVKTSTSGYFIVREQVEVLDKFVTKEERKKYEKEVDFIDKKEVKKRWYEFWKWKKRGVKGG